MTGMSHKEFAIFRKSAVRDKDGEICNNWPTKSVREANYELSSKFISVFHLKLTMNVLLDILLYERYEYVTCFLPEKLIINLHATKNFIGLEQVQDVTNVNL